MSDVSRAPEVAPSGTAQPAVRLVGLSKEFPGSGLVLDRLSVDMPAGELTSLIGPSGCGKTTALKIIAGLVPPSAGEVLVQGERVSGPGPERATVFQEFALLPWATVLRNVAFGLELRGVPRKEREEVASRYLERVNLSGAEQKYPHQLSGGMRQRVGLARALAVDADIILMDEPFASVDEQTRRQFQEDLLLLLAEERKTVVFITHSIEEAVYVSDQIVILTRGPARVSKVVRPAVRREGDFDDIRRDPSYLDCVEEIWAELRRYLEG